MCFRQPPGYTVGPGVPVDLLGERVQGVLRDILAQQVAIPGTPVGIDVDGKAHQSVVALGVRLLAEKVDDPVAAVGDLVESGRGVAKLAL